MQVRIKKMLGFISLIAGLVILAGCGPSEIVLNDYLTIDYEGYDGYGQAMAEVDLKHLVAQNAEEIDSPKGLSKEGYFFDLLEDNLEVAFDKADELSNGENITLSWNILNQEALEENLGVKFTYEDVEVEVSDLIPIETFDLFEDVDLSFSGFEPNGSVSLEANQSELNASYFEIDPLQGLSNGDTVTVKIDNETVDMLVESTGRAPLETEKEFIVEGLDAYVTVLDEITDEALSDMQKESQDLIQAYAATWDDPERFNTAEYLGSYLLTPKTTDSSTDNNRMILVYEVATTDNVQFVTYAQFYDILLLDDGSNHVDLSYYTAPYYGDNSTFTLDSLYYYGFETIDELFNDVVAVDMDLYNYETTLD